MMLCNEQDGGQFESVRNVASICYIYIAYFMLGFGFGISFYYMFYSDNSVDQLDRMKHDLAVRKEWIRMLSDQKINNSKWPQGWN